MTVLAPAPEARAETDVWSATVTVASGSVDSGTYTGYGLGLGGGFTGTPNLGLGLSDGAREYRIGWRLTPARGDAGFQVSLDAMRRESVNDNGVNRL